MKERILEGYVFLTGFIQDAIEQAEKKPKKGKKQGLSSEPSTLL
jgi:hypothetical protein